MKEAKSNILATSRDIANFINQEHIKKEDIITILPKGTQFVIFYYGE